MVRVEPTAKRIRAYLGGEPVVDTIGANLVWEDRPYPAYYVPVADVTVGALQPTARTEESPERGRARYFDVVSGGHVATDAAWSYPESPVEALRPLVRLSWAAMDAWFEEDEEVFVHPRDPHARVDILASSRHVVVSLDGVRLAESRQPRILFETGLPARYYLPLTDVRLELLRPSDTVTMCPYKGTATYWSVQIGERLVPDLVWTYRTPVVESVKIAGLACFFNEHVDLTVEGVQQQRPVTLFSQ
jgi:uncharacterized protein (DUF427 family)